MSDLNQFAVSGRLTREPELKFLPSGTAVVALGIATNRDVKKDDAWEEKVSFFDVEVYGGRAETVAKKAAKGDRVTVSGSLEQQRWENTEGEKRSKVVLVARGIEGECFYKPASENAEVAGADDTPAPAAAAASDDDIPF